MNHRRYSAFLFISSFMKRFLYATIVLMLIAGCTPVPGGPSASSGSSSSAQNLSVVASFYPLAYFARRIGGDAAAVTQITPGGVEPHDYEPSPQQIASVHDAKVFLM